MSPVTFELIRPPDQCRAGGQRLIVTALDLPREAETALEAGA